MNTLPLFMKDAFSEPVGFILATILGFGFGFSLERAGFGRANILAAQFYFTDTRVLKVMFSAIVTALLGMTVLGGLGILDLSALAVPATWIWPQLVGGLLLGMGFIISGYCPGTGVVALASGKWDGLAAIFGVMAGSVLFGLLFPLWGAFYASGSLGVLRLPELLGVPQALMALGVALMAIGAFIGAEKLERMTAARDGSAPPPGSALVRRRVFAGFVAVAVVGLLAMFVPQPETAHAVPTPGTIDAVELARRLVERPDGQWVVDVRTDAPDSVRLPGALAPDPDDGLDFLATLPPTRDLVLYDAADLPAIPGAAFEFGGHVLVLEGGYAAFERVIRTEPQLPDEPTALDLERHEELLALHAYFTGTDVVRKPPPKPRKVERKSAKQGAGC